MPLGSASRILALHSDGITTRAAVFRRRKRRAVELGRAETAIAEPGAALDALLADLRRQKIRPPTRAILGSDRAVLLRADLPVDPAHPRPYVQMRELARWETEPAFSDLPDWPLPAILRAAGLIDAEADRAIRDEMAARASHAGGGPPPRYQDVALSLGLLDRGAFDAAAALHERVTQAPGEAGCGWSPAAPGDDTTSGQHPWLLSAIGGEERAAWRAALRARKLTLAAIVPGWGLADQPPVLPNKGKADPPRPRLLLERHAGAMALLRFNGAAVDLVQVIDLNRAEADEAVVLRRALEGREQAELCSVGFDEGARAVMDAALPGGTHRGDGPGALLAGLAARGLDLPDAPARLPGIAAKEPAPPLWKRRNFYRAAMILIVTGGLGAADAQMRLKRGALESRLAELEAEYDERRSLASKIEAAARRVETLEGGVAEAEAALADLETRLANARYLQERRQEVAEGLLKALRDAIPQGVVIQSVTESRNVGEVFTLSAWAVTDIAAERFISQLNAALEPLDLVVADEAVFRAPGPQRMDGYGTRLRIAPHRATDEARIGRLGE